MAKKTRQGGLLAKLGASAKKAFDAHKGDETDFGGGGDLPEGIDGGVAQLVECKFDTYKKGKTEGEYFFYAAGIVKTPTVHNGIRVEGLRTQVGPEPMCATPDRSRKTIEEHLDWVLNELRKLGVDTAEMDLDDLETTCEALKEDQPFFRFRTWKGDPTDQFPNPRVNHQWKGVCEFDEEATAEEAVEDETDEAEEEAEEEEPEEEEAEEEEEGEEAGEAEDLEALGEAADADDEDAQVRLTELAEGQGITTDDYETWAEVAAALVEGEGAEEEEEEEEEAEEDWEPQAEEVYGYKAPKTRKAVDHEVVRVNKAKQTVDLKNTDTGKVVRGVAWADLVQD